MKPLAERAARLAEIVRDTMPRKFIDGASIPYPVEWANAPQPSGVATDRGWIEVEESYFREAVAEVCFRIACDCGARWWQVWPCPDVDRCPKCRAYVSIEIRVPR